MSIDLYKPDTGEELEDTLIANDTLTTWPEGILTEMDVIEDRVRSYEQVVALGNQPWDDEVLLEYTLRGLDAYGLGRDKINKDYVNRLIQNVLSTQLMYAPGLAASREASEGINVVDSKNIGELKLELVELFYIDDTGTSQFLHKYQLILLSRPNESGARLGLIKSIEFNDEAEARLVYDEIDSENDIGYLSRFSNDSIWKYPIRKGTVEFVDIDGYFINVGDDVLIQRKDVLKGEVIEFDTGSNEVVVEVNGDVEFYYPSELKVVTKGLKESDLKKVSYSKAYEEYVKFGKSDPDLLLKIYREDTLDSEQIETAIDRKDQLELLYTLQRLDNLHINKAVEVGDDLDMLIKYQKLTLDQTNRINALLGQGVMNSIESPNSVMVDRNNGSPTVIVIK